MHTIFTAHPDYEITCLVRSEKGADLLSKKYPSVRLVRGDLGNAAVLTYESSKADIVCHLASCEHLSAAQAIAEGDRQSSSKKKTTAWIHFSGSDILCFEDLNKETYGQKSDKV